MTLDDILLWLVGVSVVLGLMRAPRSAVAGDRTWLVLLAIAVVVAVASWLVPGYGGRVGAILLAPMFVTGFAIRRMIALARRGDTDGVRRVAHALALMAPQRQTRRFALLSEAGALHGLGRLAESEATYERAIGPEDTCTRTARAMLCALRQDWTAIGAMLARSDHAGDVLAAPLRVRALGECGNATAMVALDAEYAQRGVYTDPEHAAAALVAVLAFVGEEMALKRLLDSMPAMADRMRRFWLLTARAAGGDRDGALAGLDELARDEPSLAPAVAWRRAHLPSADAVDPAVRAHAHPAARAIALAARRVADRAATPPYWTYAVLAVYIAVYLVESLQTGRRTAVLIRLGALDPALIVAGQWWRLAMANLLHVDVMHLSMNGLALLTLGPRVERRFGAARYLMTLACGGLGCAIAVFVGMTTGLARRGIMVGASGSIMALVGVSIGTALMRRRRDAASASELRALLLVVAMQTIFDVMHPEVSTLGHAGGLVTGAALGLGWALVERRRPSPG